MILPIIKYGSSLLRSKAFDIDKGDNFTELAANISSTLKREQGLGLAGPQVSVLKNIFVIDTSAFQEEKNVPAEMVIMNPEIIHFNEEMEYYNEGCLSIPGIFEDVKRPGKIEVRYRDENFDLREEVLDGIVARIFQHEYDHLQGILFIDHLSAIRRKLLKSRLNQISKNEYP
jgi:peptide deformylase